MGSGADAVDEQGEVINPFAARGGIAVGEVRG